MPKLAKNNVRPQAFFLNSYQTCKKAPSKPHFKHATLKKTMPNMIALVLFGLILRKNKSLFFGKKTGGF